MVFWVNGIPYVEDTGEERENVLVPKEEEITVEWRKLHTEKLCDFYYPPSKIRMIKS